MLSKRGEWWLGTKCPYNFEVYDSELENRYMFRLEADSHVEAWTKRHGMMIPWYNGQKQLRRYIPDFLVRYADGSIAVVEVKDPSRVDSPEVQRKRKAAELWCRQRGMTYEIATL